MENLSKEELFKGFDEAWKRMSEENIYSIMLFGNFKKVDFCEFNEKFQKELFKILPKDVLTMGYICSGCGTWLSSTTPTSLCTNCNSNYGHDLNVLEENPDDLDVESWVKYYSDRYQKLLRLVFTTESPLDLEAIKTSFEPNKRGRYIKDISIFKGTNGCELEGQCNVAKYKNMYILQEI